MSIRDARKKRRLISAVVFLVAFTFAAILFGQRLWEGGKSNWKRGSGERSQTADDNDKLIKDQLGKDCGNDAIYVANEFYDCHGILKDANDKDIQTVLDTRKHTLEMPIPDRIPQVVPKLVKVPNIETDNLTDTNSNSTAEEVVKLKLQNELATPTEKIFVNCGGTFPWSLDLFLDTYPDADEYQLISFVPDKTYAIFYKKYQNHKVVFSECSTTNDNKTVDWKGFGSGNATTRTLDTISIAEWLKHNTNITDYVVFKIESENELDVAKSLIVTEAVAHIDKYYTSAERNNESNVTVNETIREHVTEFEFWDSKQQTYSDLSDLNPRQIPIGGKTIDKCIAADDKDKFALILFSKDTSANALSVLETLHLFSPGGRSPVSVFMPYSYFKLSGNLTHPQMKTFKIGLYFEDADDNFSPFTNDSIGNVYATKSYTNLRNRAIFSQRQLNKLNKFLNHILIGNFTNIEYVNAVQSEYNYTIIGAGKDITHLVNKVVIGDPIDIVETGRASGEYLMINIDVERAEYLVLYMMKRFNPFLIDILDCDMFG